MTWNDEYDGVVENKKEKKRDQIEWARIKFEEETKQNKSNKTNET